MLTDRHVPSGVSPLEREFVSSRAFAPDLRALVDTVLRPAIAAVRDGMPYVPTRMDRGRMGELCAAARANEVRAETLILALKDSWRRLPECYGENRLEAEIALAALITQCIGEYYRTP